MKLSKRRGGLVAAGVAAAMMLSACGGSDDNGGEGGTAAEGGGSFSVYVGEPENALIPGNTTESEGHQVISSLWTGLIEYAADGAVEYTGVADSITSEDNTTWTIELKDGWTFHDGTPVTAQSFVDAWNYTAYSPNAQGASYFFSNILGYDDLQAPTDEEGNVTGDPAAEELGGLRVIDENTFEVELAEPFAQFPVTVGYNAFWPLPEAFFEDPEGFGAQPIGNGPFQAEGEFVPGQGITVTRYEDYAGEDPANAETVEFRVYADLNTGYNDLQAGNLDVLPDLPPDAIASAEDVLGDRFLEAPSSGFTYLGYPTYDERFSDPRVRQALSMGIDRQAISDAIFAGSREPADAFVAPVVDGYREGACEYCDLDVDAANALLDEAGFDRSQPVELWFNAGAGHDAWVQAVGNQLRENLGIDYVLRGELDFAEYLPLLDEQGVTGPFRLGWAMDYPSPQNYLEPLYSTAALPPAGSNATFYSNPEFDALIQQGNSAENNEQAIEFYNQAEDILLEDMPSIPMFFDVEQAAHSENVSDVVIDVFGDIDIANVVPVS
ncbi:oligopeptide transport system substrate-binding protein [Blastococcus sp. DSM 46786]|uniref:peptide ABC transporter substrate-binding protein n=1 Tax=Blastococcus sp. DSM 46786 TaxID=1798227 RepID=UPI0008B7372B|nr:ABC transporter substrate-binding protein [Blastococcus sp. DSM 46786]SEK77550.1 oligopeptide transport system substrate-binding protein [Blastococcus sp. DSM 46786]